MDEHKDKFERVLCCIRNRRYNTMSEEREEALRHRAQSAAALRRMEEAHYAAREAARITNALRLNRLVREWLSPSGSFP